MIRTASILISYEHLTHLRAYASLHDFGPAENALETIMAEWVSHHPELIDLVRREKEAKAVARKEWEAEWK